MRSLIFAILVFFAVPTLAKCPPGQGKQHGVCKPMASKQQPAPTLDPWTPRLGALHPGKKHDVRPGEVITGEQFKVNEYIVDRGSPAPAANVRVLSVSAACGKFCIRFNRASGLVVQDSVFVGDGVNSTNDFPAGIVLSLGQRNATGAYYGPTGTLIERVIASGFKSSTPKGYPDADGFVENRGARGTTFRYIEANDNTDGGLDTKGEGTTVEHARFARNRYGMRVWGSGTATNITFSDNWNASVGVASDARWSFDYVTFPAKPGRYGDISMIDAKPGTKVSFSHCNRPAKVVGKTAGLTLDLTCK